MYIEINTVTLMYGLYRHLSKNGDTQYVDVVYDVFTRNKYDSDALEMYSLLYTEDGVCNMINVIPKKRILMLFMLIFMSKNVHSASVIHAFLYYRKKHDLQNETAYHNLNMITVDIHRINYTLHKNIRI